MKNKEVLRRVRTAYENSTPDVGERILSSCSVQKGTVIPVTDTKRKKIRIAAAAAMAAVLLLAVSLFAWRSGSNGAAPAASLDSIIMLDVNPSIAIEVSADERVLSVVPRNAEAETVIGDMDFSGSTLEVAVNAIIGSMLQNGYLSDMNNSILVSVENGDSARSAELQERVSSLIQSQYTAAVLTQPVTDDAALKALADQYGISLGKAALISEVLASDPTQTFAGLAALSINDIALISSSKQLDSVTLSGSASSGAYIGSDAALKAALEHAGVAEADATFVRTEFDCDDGLVVYEVDFVAGGIEYEVEIDASTGAVVSYSTENESYTGGVTPGAPQTGSTISAAEAKEAAFSHAGISASDAVHVDIDYERSGRYEVDFIAGGVKYEYDIDAYTGEVLKYENEQEYYAPSYSAVSVTEQAAVAAALEHAGVSEADASIWKIEFDDGCYEIEFYAGSTEYDVEVNASTGEIVKYETETHHSVPSGNTSSGSTPSGDIGRDRALQIALERAGVNAADASYQKVEFDDGRYEIEFYAGSTEYDVEVNAYTGEVVKYETEAHHSAPSGNTSSGSTPSGDIGRDRALQIALERAGLSSSDVYDVKAEFDDGRYEIEFKSGGMEYDVEVSLSGTVTKYESERD